MPDLRPRRAHRPAEAAEARPDVSWSQLGHVQRPWRLRSSGKGQETRKVRVYVSNFKGFIIFVELGVKVAQGLEHFIIFFLTSRVRFHEGTFFAHLYDLTSAE